MKILRYVIVPTGLTGLALTVPVVRGLSVTTYGGVVGWWLVLETGAAIALLVVAVAEQGHPLRGAAAGIAGASWLVPELAGWTAGPPWLTTVADAWSRILPALVLTAVLSGEPGYRRWIGAVAIAGGGLAAGSRLVLVDPFLDVRCWRRCDHNPLLLAHTTLGTTIEHLGTLVVAGCAVTAGLVSILDRPHARRPVSVRLAATALLLGCAGPAATRLFVAESPTSAAYLVWFVVAQCGAIALAAALVGGRVLQWRLRVRLVALSGGLSAPHAPRSVATSLRLALPDPQIQVMYWSTGRAAYVDAEGHAVEQLNTDGAHRVTIVNRRSQPVAALVHARDVDGARLDRALGPALRLVLENEQLQAAALAELHALTRSRTRIVERASLERRRLERNLHDGAQQRLVSLSLLVRMMARRLEHDGPGDDVAATLARRAEALSDATVQELRRVARGIYPAVLADAGLSGALLDLAESSVDVAVRVDAVPTTRYGGTLETTAYLAVTAALADARSRGARAMSVCGGELDSIVTLDMQDDAAPADRHAVLELADQVGALAGVLTVAPCCGGTRVHLELPCGS